MKTKHAKTILINVFLLLNFCLFNAKLFAVQTKPTFCVLGVKNNLKNEKWKDLGIGFGICDLITQELYNSKMFTHIETNEDIKEQIKKSRIIFWKYGNRKTENKEKKDPFKADIIFWGEITSFTVKKRKSFIGFASKYKTTVKVKITLHMIDKKNNIKLSSSAYGTAQKGAKAIFFEINNNKKLDFNSSMAGIATKQAVKKALQKILNRYKKIIKGGTQ